MIDNNVNSDLEGKNSMKDYLDYTFDSTKKDQPKIEPKTLSNKDESHISYYNKPKSQNEIETIMPNFNYFDQNSPKIKSPKKESQKQQKTTKSNIDDFQNFDKLRPHFFLIEQYLALFNIKIIESGNSINLKQVIEKIDIGINKYKEISEKENSLSEQAIILKKTIYLYDIKQKIEEIINNKNFDIEDNPMGLNFEQNQSNKINNNISNYFNNGILSSITSNNQEVAKENDRSNNFLKKKRNLKKDNTELENTEKTNNDNNKYIKKPGRLPNELKKKGVKGTKDGSHPDNGVIKIMRHSLDNIFNIFITIVGIIDSSAKIFFPGINNKDLKNTTVKQEYLKKNIEEILCSYISIESKKDNIAANKVIINDLLNKPGKEKEKNLLRKILKLNFRCVCNNYIKNIKNFIDGYTFNTFEDDEDFKKYEKDKIALILEKAEDLINERINIRIRPPQ